MSERPGSYSGALELYESALELLNAADDWSSACAPVWMWSSLRGREAPPGPLRRGCAGTRAAERRRRPRTAPRSVTRYSSSSPHGGGRIARARARTRSRSSRRSATSREVEVLNNVGIEAYYEGAGTTPRLYRRSGEWAARVGDVVNVARAQNNEAEILSDRGQLDEARALFEQALRVWRAAGYRIGIALATSNLGRVAARSGRFEEALRLLDEALARSKSSARGVRRRDAGAPRRMPRARGRHQEAFKVLLSRAGATDDRAGPRCLPRTASRLRPRPGSAGRRSRPSGPAQPRACRALGADYEVALTLEALDRTGLGDPEAGAASRAIFERIGVLVRPVVPLP